MGHGLAKSLSCWTNSISDGEPGKTDESQAQQWPRRPLQKPPPCLRSGLTPCKKGKISNNISNKPPQSTQFLYDGLQPGVVPGDAHLLQFPEQHTSIGRLGFLVQLAELEQLKLKLPCGGTGEEIRYKPIIVGMPTRPSLIQSCSYYAWLVSLNWAPIPPSCPHPNFSQTPS